MSRKAKRTRIKVGLTKEKAFIANFSNGVPNFTHSSSKPKIGYFTPVSKKSRLTKSSTQPRLVVETPTMSYSGTLKPSGDRNEYLAVHDKTSNTIKILCQVEEFMMEPVVKEMDVALMSEESDAAGAEDTKAPKSYRERTDSLIGAFGSKKMSKNIKKRDSNRISGSLLGTALTNMTERVISERPSVTDVNVPEMQASMDSTIPPADTATNRPEEVYKITDVVTLVDLDNLAAPAKAFEAAGTPQVDEWRRAGTYPTLVLSLLVNLPTSNKAARHRKACHLTYLCYLIDLFKMRYSDLRRKQVFPASVPHPVQQKLLTQFTVTRVSPSGQQTRASTGELKDKLLAHLLILLLFLDNFHIDLAEVMRATAAPRAKLLNVAKALGLTITGSAGAGTGDSAGSFTAVLKAPVGDKLAKIANPKRFGGGRR